MRMSSKWILVTMISFTLTLTTACSTKTTYEGSTRIAEPSEISKLIELGSDVIVLDVRSAEDYAKGHLEGAIHLNTDELLVNEPIKAMMAEPEKIAEVLGSKGITADSEVYIYDVSDGVNASRVWWTLKNLVNQKVEILNNGAKGLEKARLPMTLDVPKVTPVQYDIVALDDSTTATIEDTLAIVNKESDAVIIDVRSLAEFDEGAIPDAINYPHTQNYYKDGTLKSIQDIYLNYNDLGIERKTPIVLYCKSSFRATQTLVLLEEAGFENVKVYDGAWLEWMESGNPTTTFTEPVILTEQDAS